VSWYDQIILCNHRCRVDIDQDEDVDSKTPLQHLNIDSDAAAVMALERAHNTSNKVYS
jgi:hypothetical protein